MKTEKHCQRHGPMSHPYCVECWRDDHAKEKADDRLGAMTCSPSLGRKRYSSVKEMDRMTAGHFHPENKKCPKCGATLLKNLEGDEWCSLVTCDYGIEENADVDARRDKTPNLSDG